MESITEAVIRYQETKEGEKELRDRISLIVYSYPKNYLGLAEEEKGDFYLSFYNRIEGLIRNFKFRGYPFETLLIRTIKWHFKSYVIDKNTDKKLKAIEVHEEEWKVRDLLSPPKGEGEEEEIDPLFLKGTASKRRLLFLVLLDSPHIGSNEMKRFSHITGYDLDWLLSMRDRLNCEIYNRNERLRKLREKRDGIYFKLLFKETLYREETLEMKKEALQQSINRLKKRLDETRETISHIPARPTHKEVAQILKIPKGTVDSGLHYFRQKLRTRDAKNYSLFF